MIGLYISCIWTWAHGHQVTSVFSQSDIASQRIQGLLDAYFRLKSQWWARKRIHYLCECGIEKSMFTITVWHHLASLMMPIGDPWDWFFYPILTLTMDSYIEKWIQNNHCLASCGLLSGDKRRCWFFGLCIYYFNCCKFGLNYALRSVWILQNATLMLMSLLAL